MAVAVLVRNQRIEAKRPCLCFVYGLSKNALMCIKIDILINHDCLPILMLMYIMLYIMPAYLTLLDALSDAVCLHIAYFFAIDFNICFCLHALSWFIDTVCLFQIIFCIILSAFNLVVFVILCTHRFLMKGLCALWRNSTLK